ncbi:DUF6886 family protein [Erwinia persicina]|uniref:DUF6886 family protein n=1 Tax=Erwinia persicina TaxID=55211 RepID=UPI001F07843C|nr:DUF6886 family protein [Erwinia persicina]
MTAKNVPFKQAIGLRLFHFSDEPNIDVFNPRPIRVHVDRPSGQDWLNGALVWATDEQHALLYIFPRECPRIVIWSFSETTPEDWLRWSGDCTKNAIAFIEQSWEDRFNSGSVYRYELPVSSFEEVGELGMWVSRTSVTPLGVTRLSNLPGELQLRNIGLRVMERLVPLKNIWMSSVHASGVRLRNAQGWGKPGWNHTKPGRKF